MLAGLNRLRYEGYEIHMGRSDGPRQVLTGSGNVYGTYIHGVFDAPGIADGVLRAVCAQRGIDPGRLESFDLQEYKNQQYDLLADGVRRGLDMDYVYRVLRREV